MRRASNPFEVIFGALWMALMVAMAIGGIGGVLFTAGWLVLQGYDRLAACLG